MTNDPVANPTCLFFDLDGTLTDPMEGITRSVQYALEHLGEPVPEAHTLTWCIGPPLIESFEQLFGAGRAAQAVKLYRDRYGDVGWLENQTYDGIHTLLTRLRDVGVALHVATSKPHVYAQQILEHFELARFFGHIFGAELDGTRSSKAELLNHALEVVQPTTRPTMIGDRSHDIVGAKHNSMYALGVTYGYGSRAELAGAGADEIVHSIPELCAALER